MLVIIKCCLFVDFNVIFLIVVIDSDYKEDFKVLGVDMYFVVLNCSFFNS